jgi:endoribonuclease Dicer
VADTRGLTVKDLMMKLDTNCSSINFFRALGSNENIHIDTQSEHFLLVKLTQFCFSSDYRYTRPLSVSLTGKKKGITIPNIIPIEHTALFYMNTKELELFKKLPSILHQLEWSVQSVDLAFSYNLSIDHKLDIGHFKSALTYPCCQLGYDYEKLETLGDSAIKFVISFVLYYKYPDYNEGQLQTKRSGLVCNHRLYGLAYKGEIYNYINSKQTTVKDWVVPFKSKICLTENKITKKSLADVLEAVIGACALSQKCFYNVLTLMDKFEIIPKDYEDMCFDEIYTKCKVIEEYEHFITESELEVNIPETVKLADLIPIQPQYIKDKVGKFTIVKTENIELLEREVLGYTFNTKQLLVAALTHGSAKEATNYERLELLGDAILEYFIVFNLYKIHKDKLDESNLTACTITRAKSSLASNKLLIKMSILMGLHSFIHTGAPNPIQDYLNVFDPSCLMNEYQEDVINRPKALSDIFEAILGAIFIDSGLEECFKFLDRVYRKLIIYTAKYMDNIKFSVVDEFVEKCTATFGKKPIFESEAKDGMFIVSARIDDEILSIGQAHSKDGAKEIAANSGLKNLTTEFSMLN